MSASMVTLLPEPASPTLPRSSPSSRREVEILDRMPAGPAARLEGLS